MGKLVLMFKSKCHLFITKCTKNCGPCVVGRVWLYSAVVQVVNPC